MQHLLLLHGALGAAATLQPLQNVLEPHYCLHTLNFPGHGGEPLPQEPFRIELFANDVLRYLDRHYLPQVDVFGYSMGGYVALYLALHHPERVGRIFTLATKFEWSPEAAAKETNLLQPDKVAEKVPQFAATLASRHAPQDWKEVMRKTADMLQHLGAQPLLTTDTLPRIASTVRVSVGDRDNMVSIAETAWAYRLLAKGSLLVLPDTRHPLELADSHRLLQEIRQFFATTPV
ncbi:alpha/beta hydrolase [Pontibacter sp. HJ8]